MMLAQQTKPVARKVTITESQLGVLPQAKCSGIKIWCPTESCCIYYKPPFGVSICCETG